MKLKNTLGLAIASLMPKGEVDPVVYNVSKEALVYSAALDVLLEPRPRNTHLASYFGMNVRVDLTMDPNTMRIGQEYTSFNPAPVERAGLLLHPEAAALYDEWVKQA